MQDLAPVNATDLLLELGAVGAVAEIKDGQLELDALHGLSILESFFQRTPPMTVRTGGVDHIPESQKSTS